MATILKCKMCGGDISVNADMNIGTCQYCGSTMTIPHIDSDKKVRLFNWANMLRLNNEFDKAYDAYKEIVAEDTEEAEAYWGMVLSEYGVEYVEDPKTKKRVPTCHRTMDKSVKQTANYEMARKYADIENRFMYQNEADIIDKIQKKIKAISSKQEQYDAFICYKEADDESDERTQDSVLAQDIYNELNKKGINTFFSRITLKDKLGEDYEPYIYAALKSAQVMILVTTSSEHCESPWVKNEWSRFITFMSEDTDKKIIPVYKEMTAYELPDELSAYQAQDLGKVGAIQDLVAGVESLLRNKDNTKKTMSEQDVLSIVQKNKEKESKARRSKIGIGALITVAILVIALMLLKAITPAYKYSIGKKCMDIGEYEEGIEIFTSLGDYKDSTELLRSCTLGIVDQCLQNDYYKKAKDIVYSDNYIKEEGMLRLVAYCLEKGNVSEAKDYLNEYAELYGTSEVCQYFNSILYAMDADSSFKADNLLDKYDDYKQHMETASGVFHCETSNYTLIFRKDGSSFFNIFSSDSVLSLEELLNDPKYNASDFYLYYLCDDKQYYIQYENIRFLVDFSEDMQTCIITAEKQQLVSRKLFNKIYKNAEGTYYRMPD